MKIAATTIALVAAMQSMDAGAETVWQLASAYPEGNFHTANLRSFAADVAQATGGKLRIDVHANGSVAPMNEIEGRVQSGVLQAGEVILSEISPDVPIAGVDAVPFIVSSYDDARRLWKSERPVLDAELSKRGLVDLYAVPWPPQGLYSAQPIKSLADLQGLRMRTYNRASRELAGRLQAKVVEVPAAELGPAIAAGRIDCMLTSAATGVDAGVWSGMKYFYDIHAWYPKNAVLVNATALAALDAATRQAVLTAAAAAEARGWTRSEQAATATLGALAGHGVHVEGMDFTLRSEVQRQGEHISLDYVRATGADASAVLIPYYGGSQH